MISAREAYALSEVFQDQRDKEYDRVLSKRRMKAAKYVPTLRRKVMRTVGKAIQAGCLSTHFRIPTSTFWGTDPDIAVMAFEILSEELEGLGYVIHGTSRGKYISWYSALKGPILNG